jgi:CheY-like chemotaxis protein
MRECGFNNVPFIVKRVIIGNHNFMGHQMAHNLLVYSVVFGKMRSASGSRGTGTHGKRNRMSEKCNLLIIDDNSLTCWGLEKVISAQDLLVRTVNSGRDALAEVSGASYDVVFLDINLPDVSGFEVLRAIRIISPGTRVIMMSSDNTDDNRKVAGELGAAWFMGKPFSISEVKEVLRDIVNGGKISGII